MSGGDKPWTASPRPQPRTEAGAILFQDLKLHLQGGGGRAAGIPHSWCSEEVVLGHRPPGSLVLPQPYPPCLAPGARPASTLPP